MSVKKLLVAAAAAAGSYPGVGYLYSPAQPPGITAGKTVDRNYIIGIYFLGTEYGMIYTVNTGV